MNTFSLTCNHLSTLEATIELTTAYDDGVEISDNCAATIAAWFASPGAVGKHLAALSTGCTVDADDVLADISRTRREFERDYSAGDASVWRQLDQLATWVIRHG